MSDTESNATYPQSAAAQHPFDDPPAAHATTGGKSLAALKRPQYKSWRKKYRKMKIKFDGVLEENKKIFKDEQKLEGIARRLREELE
jgi:predicted nuclease with TOPRIM domain